MKKEYYTYIALALLLCLNIYQFSKINELSNEIDNNYEYISSCERKIKEANNKIFIMQGEIDDLKSEIERLDSYNIIFR